MEALISINQAQCLRDTSYFGFVRVQNVCTGAATDIPWGVVGWSITSILCFTLLGAVGFYIWLEYPRWMWLRRKRKAGAA